MKYKPPGKHRTVEEFRRHLLSLDSSMGVEEKVLGGDGPLGRTLVLNGATIGNRFAVHPMEGWDGTASGLPSEHTLRRWRNFGKSGAKLVWGGEAFAVQEDGRAHPRQLYLNRNAEVGRGLKSLLEETKQGHRETGETTDDLYVGLQLTHSGRFAQPHGPHAPRIAYRHPQLDPKVGLGPDAVTLTDGELEGIGENFVRAAKLAWNTGFQFVDVKCCHGYLLHELLGARSRPAPYGGSFENRTRFVRLVVEAIRSECPGLEIGVRVSICDVFPYSKNGETLCGEAKDWEKYVPYEHGFGIDANDPRKPDFTESLQFLKMLEGMGIRLVNISVGSPYYCPHLQRPATYPPSDGYLPPEDPLAGVIFHLRAVRVCKEAYPNLLLVGSGYSYLQEYLPNVAQHEVGAGHVDFVGIGRMVLTYPQMPIDVLEGRRLDRKRICRTFSDCTTGPRLGLLSGCFPLDSYYRTLPEAARLREAKKTNPVTSGTALAGKTGEVKE